MRHRYSLPDQPPPSAEGVHGAAFTARVNEECQGALRLGTDIERQVRKGEMVEMPQGTAALVRIGDRVIYAAFPRPGTLLGPISFRMATFQGLDDFRDARRKRVVEAVIVALAMFLVGIAILMAAISDVRTLTSIGIQLSGFAIAWHGAKRLGRLCRDCFAGRVEIPEIRLTPRVA